MSIAFRAKPAGEFCVKDEPSSALNPKVANSAKCGAAPKIRGRRCGCCG